MISRKWAILLAAGLMSSADAEVLLLAKDANKSGAVKLTGQMLDYWQSGGSFSWTFTLDKPIKGESLSVEYSTPDTRQISFKISNAYSETVTLEKTGNWNKWKTATIKNVTLPAGTHTITFTYNGKGKEYAVNMRKVKIGGVDSAPANAQKAVNLTLLPKAAKISGDIKNGELLDWWKSGGKASWTISLDAPINNQPLILEYAHRS